MTSNNRWGLERTGQLCSEILNDKLIKALKYVVASSIYDAELTLRELTTPQSLLLSLFYGLLQDDVIFCFNLIEASSVAVQLKSSYIKVWLKDDFVFKQDDVAKAFSNLAKLLDCELPFKLPQSIAVAFSGLVDKYELIEVFNLSGDKRALEFVEALNTFVLEVNGGMKTKLENNGEGAMSGAEAVTRDVDAVSDDKPTQSNKIENNSKESPDSAVTIKEENADIERRVADDETAPSTPQPETKSGDSQAAAVQFTSSPVVENQEGNEASGYSSSASTLPLSQNEEGNEASGYSSSATTLPLSQNKTQTLVGEESAQALSQSEVESEASKPLHKFSLRTRPEDYQMRQVRYEASGSSNSTPVPSTSQTQTQTLVGEESAQALSQSEVESEASKPLHKFPLRTHPEDYQMNQDGDEASGTSISLSETRLLPHSNKDDVKSCLEIAVRQNDHASISFLLESGLNVNEETESGQRLLHLAVNSSCVETVSTLLAYGAHPDLQNKDSITPFLLAVNLNSPPIIELLLLNGADVHQKFSDGNSALHKVAANGALEALKTIIKFDPAIDSQNNDGHTALHLATKAGHLHAMRALIKAGASVNISSTVRETSLHIAVSNSNMEAIIILLKANANPYLRQNSGLNSFHLTNNVNVLNLFVIHGVGVNNKTSREETLLHLVSFNGNVDVTKRLIELNAFVNATNKDKITPLMKAIEGGHTTIVSMLIKAGARINYINPKTKDAAIHLAAERGKIDSVRLLLDAGVDVNVRGALNWAPIHNAAQRGYNNVVSLLIQRGADVNVQTIDKDTPLHWAAYNGLVQTAQILIDNGADINARGDFGHTPLQVAKERKKKSIVKLLKERGAVL